MSWFTDSLKNALGITAAQKALQWVGQNSPQIANAAQSVQPVVSQVVNKAQNLYPEIQLPRMEAPSFLPSTVRWFANTVNPVNVASGIGQGLLNAPRNYIGGTVKTGLNLGNMLNDQPVPVTKLVGDAAQVGSAIMDASVFNFGKNIVKEGINQVAKPVAKQTISGLLKNAGKLSLQGAGYGGAFGVLQGAQAPNDGDINTLIKNMLQQGGEGALGGAVAAPVLHYGTKLGGKIVKDFKSLSKEERQAGYFDPKAKVELPGQKNNLDLPQTPEAVLERLKKTLEKKKEYAPEKVGVPYEPTGNVQLNLKQTQLADTLSREWSLQSPKTYDKTKSMPYIEGIIKSLGVDKIEALRRETTRYSKPKGITKFHELVQAELQGNEAFAQNAGNKSKKVTEMLKPKEVVTKPIVEAPAQVKPWEDAGYVLPEGRTPEQTVQKPVRLIKASEKPRRLIEEMKTIKDTNKDVVVARKQAESVLDKRLNPIIDEINVNNLDPEVVYDVASGKTKAPSAKYKEVADKIKTFYTDEGYEFVSSFGKKTGKLEDLPRVWDDEVADITKIFDAPDDVLDTVMTNVHRMERTGKGEGYIKDPVRAVKTALMTASNEYLTPQSSVAKEIIEHVSKLEENKTIDYVNKVSTTPKEKRLVNNTKLITFEKNASFYERTFRRIGGEIREAYEIVRDRNIPRRKFKLDGYSKSGNVKASIDYIASVIGLKRGTAKYNQFVESSMSKIGSIGLKNYNDQMLYRITHDYPLKKFMSVVSKYDFKDPKVQQVVNEFIDSQLKGEKARKNLVDKVSDTISSVFSAAQIMGNIKVALQQGTEISRIPATTLSMPGNRMGGIIALGKGLYKSIARRKELDRDFGFGQKDLNFGTGKTKLDNLIKKVGYGLLVAMENWKNSVFAGAGETIGKKKGLSGEALTKFVRNYVYRYGHIADEYMTPDFLRKSGLTRLLFQYSQFQVKNALGKVDSAVEKKYAETAGMLMSDIINATVVTLAVGTSGKYAFDNLKRVLTPFGVGPIISTTMDMYDVARDYVVDKTGDSEYKQENASKVAMSRASGLALRNVVPFGAQINKTMTSVRDMIRGYGKTMADNVKYIPSQNPVEVAQALAFGPTAFKGLQEYYKSAEKGEASGIGGTNKELITGQLKAGNKQQAKNTLDYVRSGQKARSTETKAMTPEQKSVNDIITNKLSDQSVVGKKELAGLKAANPEVLERETRIAKQQAKETGELLRPFYNLPIERQQVLMMLKALPYGTDEKKALQNENNWWLQTYYKQENMYWEHMQGKGLAKEDPDYEDIKPSKELQEKLDYFFALPSYGSKRTEFKNNNPEIQQYFDDSRARGNKEREAMGLPSLGDYASSGGGSSSVKKAISAQVTANKAKIKSVAAKIKTPRSKIKVKSIKSVLKGVKAIKKRKVLSAPARRKAIFPK